jgi:hypothetical protein
MHKYNRNRSVWAVEEDIYDNAILNANHGERDHPFRSFLGITITYTTAYILLGININT